MVLNTTIFLATDLINYSKEDIAVGFFVFVTTFFICFMPTEKKYIKMADNDIYNRMIEIEPKNEIIEMNRNYNNVDKKYGELNTFMSIMIITKIMVNI